MGLAAITIPKIILANDFVKPNEEINKGKGLTFLFQGDSVTDGNRTRDKDWNHIMGHGYVYLISSRLWFDYPQNNLMFYNRGNGGNRISDLEARWQTDSLDLKPDVISILIGINDIMGIEKNDDQVSIVKFEESYKRILDKTKAALPNTQIVLCEPFIMPMGWSKEKTEISLNAIRKMQLIVRRLAKTYNAIFVELQEPFNQACKKFPGSYWIWDGVHPMPAGHELIARQWVKAVSKKYSFIKKTDFPL